MTFPDQLKPHVERLGEGSERQGNALAAVVCDVTPRTMQLWRGGKITPNRSTQAGALLLLSRAKGFRPRKLPIPPKTPI